MLPHLSLGQEQMLLGLLLDQLTTKADRSRVEQAGLAEQAHSGRETLLGQAHLQREPLMPSPRPALVGVLQGERCLSEVPWLAASLAVHLWSLDRLAEPPQLLAPRHLAQMR